MTLVILAAGMGSRYGGMKQIDPMTENGEFIIDFSIYDAIQAGFDKVVFIIKEENLDNFRDTVGKRVEPFIKTEYAFQSLESLLPSADCLPEGRVKPWGTAHALLCAEKEVGDDNFAVINADDFYGRDAYEKIAEFLRNVKRGDGKIHTAIVGYVLKNTLTENGTVSRGVCAVDKNGMLCDIVERTKIKPNGEIAAYLDGEKWRDLPYDTIVSMNFWGFTPEIFAPLKKEFYNFLGNISDNPMKKEYLLPNIVGQLEKQSLVDIKAYDTTAKWFGVTYSEDKPYVKEGIRKMIENGEYPQKLWK